MEPDNEPGTHRRRSASTMENVRRLRSELAEEPAGTGAGPKRRDVFKIVRNVGIVCSALVGVVKAADMFGVFGDGKKPTAGAQNLNTSAGPTLPAAVDYGTLPQKKLIGGGYKASYMFSPPVFSLDGTAVYLCTNSGQLVAYDVVKGSQRWAKSITDPKAGPVGAQSPVVAKAGGVETVFVAGQSAILAVRASDGTVTKRLPYPSGTMSTLTNLGWDGSGLLCFVRGGDPSAPYAMAKLDPATGKEIKRVALKDFPAKEPQTGTPWYTGGKAIFLGNSAVFPYLVVVDLATGTVGQQNLGTGAGGQTSVAADTSAVYLASKVMNAYTAKDISSSPWEWDPPTTSGGGISGRIAVDDTSVYGVGFDNVLYAVNKATGKQKASMSMQPRYSLLTYANKTLYATDQQGAGLVAIDPLKPMAKWWCKLPSAGGQGRIPFPALVNDKVAVIAVEQDSLGEHLLYVVDLLH